MTLRSTFAWLGAVFAVMLFADGANAQAVAVVGNWLPPNPAGSAPTVDPSGTYSTPATGTWQIRLVYGTLPNGQWQAWSFGPAERIINVTAATASTAWAQAYRIHLVNTPTGCHVRAQLWKMPGAIDSGLKFTAYGSCP